MPPCLMLRAMSNAAVGGMPGHAASAETPMLSLTMPRTRAAGKHQNCRHYAPAPGDTCRTAALAMSTDLWAGHSPPDGTNA